MWRVRVLVIDATHCISSDIPHLHVNVEVLYIILFIKITVSLKIKDEKCTIPAQISPGYLQRLYIVLKKESPSA